MIEAKEGESVCIFPAYGIALATELFVLIGSHLTVLKNEGLNVLVADNNGNEYNVNSKCLGLWPDGVRK